MYSFKLLLPNFYQGQKPQSGKLVFVHLVCALLIPVERHARTTNKVHLTIRPGANSRWGICRCLEILVETKVVEDGVVWKIKKALYGLRTSPCMGNGKGQHIEELEVGS